MRIVNFVFIFLSGDNTFDANKAVNNSQLGQKLYEGYSQGRIFSSFDRTWIVYLSNFYSIYHVTFFFRNGKTTLDIGLFTSSPSNNNYGWTFKSSQRSYILKILNLIKSLCNIARVFVWIHRWCFKWGSKTCFFFNLNLVFFKKNGLYF